MLVPLATPGAILRCRFSLAEEEIRVHCSVPSRNGGLPPMDGFPWQVLVTLTDEGIETGFQPNRRLGRAMTQTLGLRRDSLDLVGTLLSGFIRVVLKHMEKRGTQVVYLRGNHDDVLARFLPLEFGRLSFVEVGRVGRPCMVIKLS